LAIQQEGTQHETASTKQFRANAPDKVKGRPERNNVPNGLFS